MTVKLANYKTPVRVDIGHLVEDIALSSQIYVHIATRTRHLQEEADRARGLMVTAQRSLGQLSVEYTRRKAEADILRAATAAIGEEAMKPQEMRWRVVHEALEQALCDQGFHRPEHHAWWSLQKRCPKCVPAGFVRDCDDPAVTAAQMNMCQVLFVRLFGRIVGVLTRVDAECKEANARIDREVSTRGGGAP